MNAILVVGPTVPKNLEKTTGRPVIHKPCLSLVPLDVPRAALLSLYDNDGAIITSKHAAFFLKAALQAEGLTRDSALFFSVGIETSAALQSLFPSSQLITASQSTQEGVAEIICQSPCRSCTWFRSTHARRYLPNALHAAHILLSEHALYTPRPVAVDYTFDGIDEIFFTCPSSVEIFFSITTGRTDLPGSYTAIGPITEEVLNKHLSTHKRIQV